MKERIYMKVGFGKVNITPRVGVELSGFGPFINRRSIAVRDNLWARAMAVEQKGKTVVIVSCDIVGLSGENVAKVRAIVRESIKLPDDAIMVHCIHTHSGPATSDLNGWGAKDGPYMEILPYKIAKACVDAVNNLCEATLSHAEVPCEGVALNRQYDKDGPPLDEVLKDSWRPAKPELTDTTCHVMKVESGNKVIGFLSYFGCHPVVCCQETRYIHGDYAGVATNCLEREFPGSVGLFLQGAHGDVNSCVVYKPEPESMLALDVIAARYANSVRNGLSAAKKVNVDRIETYSIRKVFSEKKIAVEALKEKLALHESLLHKADADDHARDVRMSMVFIECLRKIIPMVEQGLPTYPPVEVHGIKLGPISLLGAPFEIYQAIKNDVKKSALSEIPLVMSCADDYLGYIPDNETALKGGYAPDIVPMILGHMPFADGHNELVGAFLKVDKKLNNGKK